MRTLTPTEMDNVSGGTLCLLAATGLSVLALSAFFSAIGAESNNNKQPNTARSPATKA